MSFVNIYLMKTSKPLLMALTLILLAIPLVYAITFIGATNFIATHGGNVTFAENFTATSLTYPNGLNRFTNIVWGGHQRGNLGVDVDAGANMTVTNVGRDQVNYNITTAAPGAIVSYIYYRRNVDTNPLSAPSLVTVDGVDTAFTYAGGIASITTTGSPRTVVAYYMGGGVVAAQLFDTAAVTIGLITLLVLLMVVHAVGVGDMSLDAAWKVTLLAAIIAAVAYLVRSWGY